MWWDMQLLEKVRELEERAKLDWRMHFYMRYVDDSNIISDIVESGIRYVDNQLIKIEEKVEEDKVPEDQRTAILLRKIANSICDFIEVEVDCPTMHQTKRLPILDLEVETVNNNVEYRYYI